MWFYLPVGLKLNSTKVVGERLPFLTSLKRKVPAQKLVLVVFPQLQR
jgi:hypothetical protein